MRELINMFGLFVDTSERCGGVVRWTVWIKTRRDGKSEIAKGGRLSQAREVVDRCREREEGTEGERIELERERERVRGREGE